MAASEQNAVSGGIGTCGLGSRQPFWFPQASSVPVSIPFDIFLLKIASRCNLACPYCYVYELQDQTWKRQPSFMDESTLKMAVERIRDHVTAHGLHGVSVIFHGGEPLLVGALRLHDIAAQVRDQLCDIADVHLGMQTNGTLLDDTILQVAIQDQIHIGLSIDGPPAHHDRFRYDHNGRGTSEQVETAAKLLSSHPEVFGGVLCVVNLDIDPADVFDYFSTLHAASIDLLLPHGTYDHLPPGVSSPRGAARYGEWMVRFLERWYKCADCRPNVRFFSSIMRLLLGGRSLVESIGLEVSSLVVIESNGEIEAVDALKVCYPGAASTGLSIFRNSFDEALQTPAIMSRQMRAAALCDACRMCPFLEVCGGGYQPHRYSHSRGFLNPSIYCDALQLLISRTASLMKDDLSHVGLSVPSRVEALANARFNSQGF